MSPDSVEPVDPVDPVDPGEPAGPRPPEPAAPHSVVQPSHQPQPTPPVGLAGVGEWQRLSVRQLLLQPLTAVKEALPAIIPVVVLGATGDMSGLGIAAVVTVISVLAGVASWYSTEWRIAGDRLEVRRGIVSRQASVTRLDRVRSVDVQSSLLQRLLGIAQVKVGTGASDDIELSGLERAVADDLRTLLLARRQAAVADRGGVVDDHGEATAQDVPAPGADPAGSPDDPLAGPEREVVRLRPAWIGYAPFTLSGLAVLAGAVGAASQVFDDLYDRVVELPAVVAVVGHLTGEPLARAVAEVAATVLVLFALGAMVAYVLRFWDFRLVRRGDGTLRITRGLTTTYSSTVELARLRGVVLRRPVLLRLVGGATASTLVAGQGADSDAAGSDLLLPPAPAAEARRVAADVLGDREALEGPLTQHGPAARRRRHTRALWLPAFAAAAVAVPAYAWDETPLWAWAVPAVLLALAPVLAEARYASLGHALTDEHLVARSGVFPQERVAVRRDGVIAWNVDATFFQRRAGLVTLTAVTAAPMGGDAVIADVAPQVAARIVESIDPATFAGWRAGPGPVHPDGGRTSPAGHAPVAG